MYNIRGQFITQTFSFDRKVIDVCCEIFTLAMGQVITYNRLLETEPTITFQSTDQLNITRVNYYYRV